MQKKPPFRNRNGERLTKAKYATVIFLSTYKPEVKKISDVNSLKCKMTFIDWYNYALERQFNPIFLEAKFEDEQAYEEPIWERLDKLRLI